MPGSEPTETTRLRLEHEGDELVAHLSAMTVQHGGLGLYHEKASKLGPDPLREDADVELLWAKLPRIKKSIGLVLMDQTAMAGECIVLTRVGAGRNRSRSAWHRQRRALLAVTQQCDWPFLLAGCEPAVGHALSAVRGGGLCAGSCPSLWPLPPYHAASQRPSSLASLPRL